MMELIAQLGPWIWVILAVSLFVLETIIPGIHFLWFGLAAMLLGLALLVLAQAAPDLAASFGWQWQVIVFALLAVSTVFFVRRYAADPGVSDLPHLNLRGSQYVGRVVTVAEAIQNGRGKVRINDTLWQARTRPSARASALRLSTAPSWWLSTKTEPRRSSVFANRHPAGRRSRPSHMIARCPRGVPDGTPE